MDIRAILMGLAFAVMWSSAFTSARIIVMDASPLLALSLRYLISGLIGVGIALALGQSWRLTPAQWRATIIFGVLLIHGLVPGPALLGANFPLIAPMFAALYASRRRLELQRLVRLCAWASAALTLALTALLIVFGKTVVGLLGEEFDAGYPVLVVLLLGAAASATTGSAAVLLTMTNHQGLSVKVFAGGTAINIVLSAILIPRYGVLGTAVANAISTAACSVVLVYLVKKRLGIWSVIGRLP